MARVRRTGSGAARSIADRWDVAALPPAAATTPADLEQAHPDWIQCPGPMPAAAALRAVGRWDMDSRRDFDAQDWWYRCRFAAASDEPLRLIFEGLATIADVWLNGSRILHSESMFVAHTVVVDRDVRADNELVVRFHALSPRLAAKRPRPRWRTALVAQQSLRWHRTSLLGRMPAWCPSVAPVGPWRPILVETSAWSAEKACVHAEVEGDGGVVRLTLALTHSPGARVSGTLIVDNCEVPLTCATSGNSSKLAGVARLARVQRWWPHTHGSQPLYDARASVAVDGTSEIVEFGRVGFRTLELDRGSDGNGFGFIVNGAAVFSRGVCWTPLDLARLSASPEQYRVALERLREAGTNMVRVPGTMTYEADAFYDLCDELGIMVWQDLMFANMDYPWDDEAFAGLATREATQTLEALQSRPSCVVVCGNSEVEQQAAMLGLPAARRSLEVPNGLLASLVRDNAPHVAWVPSTPTGGTLPFHVDAGVSHYYGVGAYRRPFEDARRANVRFAAECLAFSNVPDPPTIELTRRYGDAGHGPHWKAAVPRDAGAGWDYEDVRDHYVERLFGLDPLALRSRDLDRYLAIGRVATGEAMFRTFAEWRRPGSNCRGGLVWFAHDLQPGAGWGVVDSSGWPKAAYWYLRRALAPVALFFADEGLNGLWLHAVNDTAAPLDVDLRVALYRRGFPCGVPARTSLLLPARGHRSVHVDALFDGFMDLTYSYRFGPAGHDVVCASLRDAGTDRVRTTGAYFPDTLPADDDGDLGLTARAEPTDDGCTVTLETQRFAHAVAIDFDGYLPSDNYFSLEPGQAKHIALQRTTDAPLWRGTVSALNGGERVPIVLAKSVHAR